MPHGMPTALRGVNAACAAADKSRPVPLVADPVIYGMAIYGMRTILPRTCPLASWA